VFDSLEQDLTAVIRSVANVEEVLTDEEKAKANAILLRQTTTALDPASPYDQLMGLDLGTKFQVLMRVRNKLGDTLEKYYKELSISFDRVIPIRNAIMHGRPLTIAEYSIGFEFAQQLLLSPARWPNLHTAYTEYSHSPESYSSRSIATFDSTPNLGVLHNLPRPDYEDTGFFPRNELERDLKRKIMGRYPVITVLGDGGNGKTALTLQTIYSIIESNDHNFDLILWFSAKTSALSAEGVREIANSVTNSATIINEAAEFEPGNEDPVERLRRLLEQNRVLLVIDNLETVTGGLIRQLVEDVPGQSKILLTSRVPVGGDLSITVPEFGEPEAISFLRNVAAAHDVRSIKALSKERAKHFCTRLGYKPLLIKWFVLGVKSGLDPNKIVADPEIALRFCLENVIEKLTPAAQTLCVVLATVGEAASATVINEVSKLSHLQVDEGLTELVRFGLVEAKDPDGVDRVFKLRGFVRSYVSRVIQPSAETTSEIREKYQKIDNQFRENKVKQKHNRYDMRFYVVRTLSEYVAAQSLRQIIFSLTDEYSIEIERKLGELKIKNPAYFEVYRVEAHCFARWSDISRAVTAYEAALEFGKSEPQLHFFFAGLLMRNGFFDRAEEEFSRAIKLDPGNPLILREAARNAFQQHEYQKAEDFLSAITPSKLLPQRDSIIMLDLWIQLHIRRIHHFVELQQYTEAMDRCNSFYDYLKNIDTRLFDRRVIKHLEFIYNDIAIIRHRALNVDLARLDLLSELVRKNAVLSDRKSVNHSDSSTGSRLGFLKQNGRKPTYGFIVEGDGTETFIAAITVTNEVWQWLVDNGAVLFDIKEGQKGPQATNVSKYHGSGN
jgi:tetratricopeptide (TPR) repeat protein